MKDYDNWEKSNLRNRSETEFDLLRIVDRHHQVVTNEFSVVIHASYGKNLDRLEAYFLGLQSEAKKIQENAVATIITALPASPEKGSLTFREIPHDPLGELGLTKKEKADLAQEHGTVLGKTAINLVIPSSPETKAPHNGISLMSHRTEERDRYFDVRKNDIVGFHPEMENLDFDPFPDAKNDEVVHKVFMGRELVLYAKLRGPVDAINLGMALQLNGHRFGLNEVKLHFEAEDEHAKFDVEGSEWLNYVEPLKLIAKIRKDLAKKGA